jgi:hypothetical protein
MLVLPDAIHATARKFATTTMCNESSIRNARAQFALDSRGIAVQTVSGLYIECVGTGKHFDVFDTR